MTSDQKARACAIMYTSIWASWSDTHQDDRNNALRLVAETVRTVDLHTVDGTMASPLNYFTRAYLDDTNPEDLTYSEMMQSMEISLAL